MSTAATSARIGLPVGSWQVDPIHSHVGFAVKYTVGTFRGTFTGIDARLVVGEDGAASLEGGVQAANVKVQDESLNAHLLSPEFFDAERTPDMALPSGEPALANDVELTAELYFVQAS